MTGYFITGTDTGIGKTVLSALLVAALDATYWKPIQTGALEGKDRESVRQWAEVPEERLPSERYVFDPPVSPHLAAREAGVKISLEAIQFPEIQTFKDIRWIIEGAGGVMVPINDQVFMLDLMRQLELPVIVATRTTLGTINHTLLTLSALRAAGLRIHGVVMIGHENIDNRRAIEDYGRARVIGHIPVLNRIDRAALLRAYAEHFDHPAFAAKDDSQPHSMRKQA